MCCLDGCTRINGPIISSSGEVKVVLFRKFDHQPKYPKIILNYSIHQSVIK